MKVYANHRSWSVDSAAALDEALAWRDARGGAMFWLADEPQYPTLAIRVTGMLADVHYFPIDGHPGFRCLGGQDLPEGGSTTLVYEGCDPSSGEETPNEFVVPFATARSVANDFLSGGQMSSAVSWFEL